MDTWLLENLVLVLGIALILGGIISAIKVWNSQNVNWQEVLGIIVVFILGGVITLSQIGLL